MHGLIVKMLLTKSSWMSIVLVPELLQRFKVGLCTASLTSLPVLDAEVLGLTEASDVEEADLSRLLALVVSDGIISFN